MTWVLLVYLALGYYHFHLTLQHLQSYDTWDTVLLNTALALTIGPCLLIPALTIGKVMRWIRRLALV